MPEEQNRPVSTSRTLKRVPRSLGARVLLSIAGSAGLAVVACLLAYNGGMSGMLRFAYMPGGLVLCFVAAHMVVLVILSLLGHPLARESLPIFFGMVTFAAVTLCGSLLVVPRVHEQEVRAMKSSAVDAVERHRQRTGTFPPSKQAPEGIPDGVSYARAVDENRDEDGSAYTLFIENRFDTGRGWRFDSTTATWTYSYGSG